MSVRVYSLYRKSPLLERAVLTSIVLILTVLLNIFVYKYYSKSTTKNKPYVLALVFLDNVSVFLGLLPTFIISLFEMTETVQELQFVMYCFANYLFLINICPHVFLCVDRFLSVLYPHKFKDFSSKIRLFRICIAVVMTYTTTQHLFCERYFGPESVISQTVVGLAWSVTLFLIATTVVMYFGIAVRLYRRNKDAIAR